MFTLLEYFIRQLNLQRAIVGIVVDVLSFSRVPVDRFENIIVVQEDPLINRTEICSISRHFRINNRFLKVTRSRVRFHKLYF